MSYFANCHRPQLSVYEVDAGLVHSLHRWRYAYREGLTTVMVRHLATGARLAIRCSSFVKKVSVFGDRLAVQLGDRVSVCDLGSDGGQGGAPAPQKKIAQVREWGMRGVDNSVVVSFKYRYSIACMVAEAGCLHLRRRSPR